MSECVNEGVTLVLMTYSLLTVGRGRYTEEYALITVNTGYIGKKG